jgi:hypothetical protein
MVGESPATTIVLLTGAPGVGKTTVSALVPSIDPACVVIESDLFRMMLRGSSRPPWEMPEGRAHEQLVVDAVAHTTRFFVQRGFARFVLVDTASQSVVERYREELGEFALRVVKLICSDSERVERLGPRAYMTDQQADRLTEHVGTMITEDAVVDTSELEPLAAAQRVVSLL